MHVRPCIISSPHPIAAVVVGVAATAVAAGLVVGGQEEILNGMVVMMMTWKRWKRPLIRPVTVIVIVTIHPRSMVQQDNHFDQVICQDPDHIPFERECAKVARHQCGEEMIMIMMM